MVTEILAMLLAMNTASLDNQDDARKSLNNCVIKLADEHLDKKASASEFKKAAADACTAEKQAYIEIMTKDEMKYGSSRSEAEQYANEEAQNIVDGWTASYSDYLDSNTRPLPEK